MIKFFSIQKNNKMHDNQPDYRITTKTKDSFVELGACWKKKDKSGKDYLSCKLGDSWKDHTNEKKTRKGWHIEEDGAETKNEETEL